MSNSVGPNLAVDTVARSGVSTLSSSTAVQSSSITVLSSNISTNSANISTNAASIATKAPRMDGEPNGFVDRSDAVLSWDTGTRTLTITPAVDSFQFWCDGTLYTKTQAETATITDTEGVWYIYYDASGVLQASQSVLIGDIILRWSFVCYLYWDATNNRAIPNPVCEMHGAEWPAEVHRYQHLTAGARLVLFPTMGCALTVPNGDGSLDAHCQFSSTAGAIMDEDIDHTIGARTGTAATLRVMYRLGGDTIWRMGPESSFPIIRGPNSRAYYNSGSGATFGLTEATSGNHVLAHVYAVPGLNPADGALHVVMGTAEYSSIALARTGAVVEITNTQLQGLPVPEMVHVATLIVETRDQNTNSVNSRFVALDVGSYTHLDCRDVNLRAVAIARLMAT